TFIEGDVSFLRAGTKEWADAAENIPLLTGDQIYTARGARAEIQLSRGNYIRLSEETELTFTDFSDAVAQFEVTEGSILVRLERFGSSFNRFEVDTPNAAMVLKQDGFYRVNVRGEDFSEMIARDGSAEVTTDDGVFTVREGYRLVVDSSSNGKLDIARADSRDEWEQWSSDRDTTIDRVSVNLAPDYVRNYETTYNSFYGVSDLYDYGTWTNYGSYGYCWVPRVSSGWAPYRYGQWIWLPRTGWTWWSSEPWGWAPYHHGRWVFINGLGWAWSPGFHPSYYRYNYRYYRWRPALVGFFNCPTPRGHYVGWYPLRPGERWRRPDHSHLQYGGARDGWRRPRSDDNWRRPIAREGITTIPVDGFARPDRSRSRPQAPDRDVDRWVKDGSRPGLPDIGTSGWVTSPVRRFDDGQPRAKRGITPPQEVINRPVVTRNRPSNSDDGDRPNRQRRLLNPRQVGGTEVAAPGARRSRASDNHGDDSSKKGNADSNRNNRPSIHPRRDDSG
ncbi:MAG TPA: FecR family protein, partial [Blastocatellia bacterium]